jgi:hypothetical protein
VSGPGSQSDGDRHHLDPAGSVRGLGIGGCFLALNDRYLDPAVLSAILGRLVGDAAGRRRLARYMIRNPFALTKMTYYPKTAMVIYRSQMHATLKRNYQLMPALKWLRLLLNHIPDKYEHSNMSGRILDEVVYGIPPKRSMNE